MIDDALLAKFIDLFPRSELEEYLETEGFVVGPYRAFQDKYRDDPCGFVLDCIKWGADENPALYQLDIMRRLVEHKRGAVVSPHGTGKTATAAWIVHWFVLTRDGTDWKVPTTASVYTSWRSFSGRRYENGDAAFGGM